MRLLYAALALGLVSVADGFFEQLFGGGDVEINFGGGGGLFGGGRRKTQDANVKVEVSLEDFYNGRTVPLSLQRRAVCSACKGSGAKSLKKCTKCNGRGVVRHPIHPVQQHCPMCGGKGQIPEAKCPVCKGNKHKKETVKHSVTLPRGAKADHVVTLKGQADEAPGAEAGDVHVHFTAQPHNIFARDGPKLMTSVPISLGEALLGFKRQFDHLDGHSVTLESSTTTQHATVQTVAGEGMPMTSKGSRFGVLEATYLVKYPAMLTGEQIEALKQGWPEMWAQVEEQMEDYEEPEEEDEL